MTSDALDGQAALEERDQQIQSLQAQLAEAIKQDEIHWKTRKTLLKNLAEAHRVLRLAREGLMAWNEMAVEDEELQRLYEQSPEIQAIDAILGASGPPG